MKSYLILALTACLLLSVDARLPRNPSTSASVESEQPQDDNRNAKAYPGPVNAEDGGSSEESDERPPGHLHTYPEQNPFSLLERIFDMHLGSVRNMQKNRPGMQDTSVISIQPVMPPYNPFGGFGYPEPTIIRRPSILGNRFPFPSSDPFDMSSTFPNFPNFGQLPGIAHPSMFDVNDEKIPEGYEKVKETIEGPEGRQTIHTTYEKKNTEGPNQFYGIIVKIRPYKANGSKQPAADSPAKPDQDAKKNPEDAKKQDDRRVAAENKPQTEREVEESALNPTNAKPNSEKKGEEEKPKPTEEKKSDEKKPADAEEEEDKLNKKESQPEASPEKKDTDALAKDNKPQSENEIPKSEEAPLITVNDNSKGNQ